jgi:hypothetical protein
MVMRGNVPVECCRSMNMDVRQNNIGGGVVVTMKEEAKMTKREEKDDRATCEVDGRHISFCVPFEVD